MVPSSASVESSFGVAFSAFRLQMGAWADLAAGLSEWVRGCALSSPSLALETQFLNRACGDM
eukprot:5142844-Pleurochrysis_carterae.AAC.1